MTELAAEAHAIKNENAHRPRPPQMQKPGKNGPGADGDGRGGSNVDGSGRTGNMTTFFSDHLLLVRAFEAWEDVRRSDGVDAATIFCKKYFLIPNAMDEIMNLRLQFKRFIFFCFLTLDFVFIRFF